MNIIQVKVHNFSKRFTTIIKDTSSNQQSRLILFLRRSSGIRPLSKWMQPWPISVVFNTATILRLLDYRLIVPHLLIRNNKNINSAKRIIQIPLVQPEIQKIASNSPRQINQQQHRAEVISHHGRIHRQTVSYHRPQRSHCVAEKSQQTPSENRHKTTRNPPFRLSTA